MVSWWIVYVNDDPRGAEPLMFITAVSSAYLTFVNCKE